MRRIEGFICAGLLVVFVLAVVLSFQDGETSLDAAAHPGLASDRSFGSAPLVPLLPGPALPPDKVALGERLFHDTRLSHDDTVSCATCHSLSSGGVDQLPVSIGINGAEGGINAPTVFNSALSFVQFWDGRAATLVDQASGPVHNPIEMGSNWPEVLAKLGADVSYVEAFEQIYPDGLTAEAIVDAIVTFERSLITPNSPFDRYLNGERHALSLLER
ncbi:MAG: cytochrome-c peroxidase, partial [Rhodospirillaceae bacterium]